MNKLAVFDIDGTIANNSIIAPNIIDGFRHIQSKGFLTTVSTGRGYRRMRHALGDDFDTVISPESLIILEHGGKIVDKTGKVVYADYFAENEIRHIIDFIRSNEDIVNFIWFVLPDPAAPYQVWCKRPEDVEAVREKRGEYSDVFHASYEELQKRMLAEPLSSVVAILEDFISVHNLKLHFTRSEIDVMFQERSMDFVKNISDKSKAVLYLEKHLGIAVENMLVAGNAINDADMLSLPAGRRILVGTDAQAATVIGHIASPETIIRVESPEKLGLYLQEITG